MFKVNVLRFFPSFSSFHFTIYTLKSSLMASEGNWYGFTSRHPSDLFNAYVLKKKKNDIFFFFTENFKNISFLPEWVSIWRSSELEELRIFQHWWHWCSDLELLTPLWERRCVVNSCWVGTKVSHCGHT